MIRREDYERGPMPKPIPSFCVQHVVPVALDQVCDVSYEEGERHVGVFMTGQGETFCLDLMNAEDADTLITHLIAARNRLWPTP